jgi:hypothetical protein
MNACLRILMLTCLTAHAQQSSDSVPPVPSTGDSIKLDPASDECFRKIRDREKLAWRKMTRVEEGSDDELQRQFEEIAYEKLLIHAAKFPQAELEAAARRDLPFGSLLADGGELASRRLELVSFDGTLKHLVRVDNLVNLKNAGIKNVYEAYVFPKGNATPICLFLTELPPGLEPMKDVQKETLNVPVRITGYFFKLMYYEQRAVHEDDPNRHKLWMAPVLVGKSLTLLNADDLREPETGWKTTFLPLVIGGILATGVLLVWCSWRYRRGDQAILEKALEKRNQNPFDNV